ncbi:hypothetical protein ACFGVS_15660 [Mucilaginibacter sp. AW1-7]|jgi:hypothetical protein|uniref:hypothetical protein n=1 Tax=unclassified Mucilaginibacter TaxID=2617802 RepID=UPI0008ADB677|nr:MULTISPECIES: hypothetical protein [unclassified Mucilaginibacter]WDF78869.1 hypothetical protein PQ469_02460 [Mucilaginibacter sp. KACC 22773]SEO40370.1 hypothetical protein SAMN05428947_102246 [Mucilaginibacter sp. OK283]
MKRVSKIILFVIALGLMVGVRQPVKAQCAQCAATVETNTKSGGNAAKGLNKGILFLLGAPYFVVAVGGYIWYKKYRRKNVNLNDMRHETLNLN